MALYPDPDSHFGPWTLDDVVVGPAVVPFLEDGDPADLSGTTASDGRLRDPAGLDAVPGPVVAVDAEDPSALTFTLNGNPFLIPGVYSLTANLSVGGNTFRTAPARFVVDADDGWTTVSDSRSTWRDAPSSDVVLFRLLSVAKTQVLEYGRDDIVGPTDDLVTAQQTQARNIWNAVKSDPATQGIGDEGFVIRPFPLDWTVKNLIRPQSAKPVVR